MKKKLFLLSVLTFILFAIPAMATTVCPVREPFDLDVEGHIQVNIWEDAWYIYAPDVDLIPVEPEGYRIAFYSPVNMDYAQVKALDGYTLERAPWDGSSVTGNWEEVPGNEICVQNTVIFQTKVNELTNWLWRTSVPDYVNPVSCDEGPVTADISINYLESPDLGFEEVFTIEVSGDPFENNICAFEVFLKVDCESSSDYGVWYWEDPYWLPLDVEFFSDGDKCYVTFFDDVFDRVYGFGEKPQPEVFSGDMDGTTYYVSITPCPGVGEINTSFDITEVAMDDLPDVGLDLTGLTSEDVLFVTFNFEDPTGICGIQVCWEAEEGETCDDLADLGVFYFSEGSWEEILVECDDSEEPTLICFALDDPELIQELLGDPGTIYGVGDTSIFVAPSDDDDDHSGGGGGCNVGVFSAGLLLLMLPLGILLKKKL